MLAQVLNLSIPKDLVYSPIKVSLVLLVIFDSFGFIRWADQGPGFLCHNHMRGRIDVMKTLFRSFFFCRYVYGKFSRLVFYLVSMFMIRILLLIDTPAA